MNSMAMIDQSAKTSCDLCRQRRTKCIRLIGQAYCNLCISKNKECEFNIPRSKRGPKPKNKSKNDSLGSSENLSCLKPSSDNSNCIESCIRLYSIINIKIKKFEVNDIQIKYLSHYLEVINQLSDILPQEDFSSLLGTTQEDVGFHFMVNAICTLIVVILSQLNPAQDFSDDLATLHLATLLKFPLKADPKTAWIETGYTAVTYLHNNYNLSF